MRIHVLLFESEIDTAQQAMYFLPFTRYRDLLKLICRSMSVLQYALLMNIGADDIMTNSFHLEKKVSEQTFRRGTD